MRLPRGDLQGLRDGHGDQARSFGLTGPMHRKTIAAGTIALAGREFQADGLPCVDLARFIHALESEICIVIKVTQPAAFTAGLDCRTNTLELTPRP